jgi:hypothetical protein
MSKERKHDSRQQGVFTTTPQHGRDKSERTRTETLKNRPVIITLTSSTTFALARTSVSEAGVVAAIWLFHIVTMHCSAKTNVTWEIKTE